ncbi:MAG: hypothetical protein NTV23_12725 [Propionibacteriales bacterium]|nr:hypothetical protein [Propionibacteriales bacterium]
MPGNFCRNCGAALAAPSVAPVPATPAPAAPMVNPFAGLALTDVARDLGALVLLFGALALPWDVESQGLGDGSDRWWVVVATIVSALSVGVPYLVRLELVPGWGAPQSRLVKWVAAVPYLVGVLAVLVNHLIHVNDNFEGILGPGVGVGLAGALLAAQVRGFDEEPTGVADGAWRTALFAVLGGGTVLVALTALVSMALDFGDVVSVPFLLGYTVLLLGSYVVVVVLPFVGFLSGGREWGRVLAVVGFSIVTTQFLGGASDSEPLFAATGEGLKDVFGVFLVAAGTALLVSRPIQRRLLVQPPIESWVSTARRASTVLAVALGVSAAGRLLVLVAGDTTTGTEVVALVLLVLGAAVGVVVGALLGGDPDRARPVVVGLAGGVLLLAVVEIAVARSGEWGYLVTPAEAVGWFAMPGLVLFSLLYPQEIRATFRPIAGTPHHQPPQPPVTP